VQQFGERELLARLSNPHFFQSLGCALGFDWHSSGLTTTTCGALKEGLAESDCGVKVMGGKGAASKRTPDEIEQFCLREGLGQQGAVSLVHASKMSAKVDSALVQDGYELYHHSFFVTSDGAWAVVQQGLNDTNGFARRYHWLGFGVKDFVVEPHHAVCCNVLSPTLNLTGFENEGARKASVDLIKEGPGQIRNYAELHLPREHWINPRTYSTLASLHDFNPSNYAELAAFRGVGAKTVRALALVSQLVYGTELSWRDPCRFSFAHGGKDGTPFPVERAVMDESTIFLQDAIDRAKLGDAEKKGALKRLADYYAEVDAPSHKLLGG
jgi:hypothetical protein